MAAPTPTTRQAPAGRLLENGFRSLITLSRDPDIEFYERSVGMPGLDGGPPIDITTMHNVRWKTKSPQALIEGPDVVVSGGYDPVLFSRMLEQINIRQTITHTFPDGSTYCYFGFVQRFTPSAMNNGEFPMAEMGIVQTNWDPTNDVEADPVLAEVAGT
jgi:hypothetical protein